MSILPHVTFLCDHDVAIYPANWESKEVVTPYIS